MMNKTFIAAIGGAALGVIAATNISGTGVPSSQPPQP